MSLCLYVSRNVSLDLCVQRYGYTSQSNECIAQLLLNHMAGGSMLPLQTLVMLISLPLETRKQYLPEDWRNPLR